MASSGRRCGLCAFAVVAALPETIDGSGLGIVEDAGAGYDLREFRMRQRHLDDDDGVHGGVGIDRGVGARASGQFFCRTNACGARDVDVDIVLVLGIDEEGMGVGASAGLDVYDLLGVGDIADVEDADALNAVWAGRWWRG